MNCCSRAMVWSVEVGQVCLHVHGAVRTNESLGVPRRDVAGCVEVTQCSVEPVIVIKIYDLPDLLFIVVEAHRAPGCVYVLGLQLVGLVEEDAPREGVLHPDIPQQHILLDIEETDGVVACIFSIEILNSYIVYVWIIGLSNLRTSTRRAETPTQSIDWGITKYLTVQYSNPLCVISEDPSGLPGPPDPPEHNVLGLANKI